MSFSGSKSTNASRLGMLWACLRERRIVDPWMLAMIIFVFNEDEKLVSMMIESREDVWKRFNIRKSCNTGGCPESIQPGIYLSSESY